MYHLRTCIGLNAENGAGGHAWTFQGVEGGNVTMCHSTYIFIAFCHLSFMTIQDEIAL